jgi:trk system potassium uptake protein TrkA
MKIVIVGAGTLGLQIARELVAEGRDVVIIEKKPDIAMGIANELDCLVKEGDGENLDLLASVGAAEADWFIALTGNDDANIVACGLVAETFKRPRTIARVRSHYFSSFHDKRRRILGVDHILNPEYETAQAVARIIFRGMSPETIDVKEAGIQLRKMPASADQRFPNRTLQQIRNEIGKDFIIPGVVREGEFIAPSGQFTMEAADLVYILGEPGELDRLFGQTGRRALKLKHLTLFGAGQLTALVLKELGVPALEGADSGSKSLTGINALTLLGNPIVKVIDGDYEQVKGVSRVFTSIETIHRDLSDEFLIEEEGIGLSDIVLCLSGSQGDNLATALVSKLAGARRVLAVIFNDLYMRLEGSAEIDAIVNQKSVTAGAILDLVRRANIRRLHHFMEGPFELIELAIGAHCAKAGRRIAELGLPKGILVAFVIHEGKTIVPSGDTVIHEKDSIGLVLSKERIVKLESLFGV